MTRTKFLQAYLSLILRSDYVYSPFITNEEMQANKKMSSMIKITQLIRNNLNPSFRTQSQWDYLWSVSQTS